MKSKSPHREYLRFPLWHCRAATSLGSLGLLFASAAAYADIVTLAPINFNSTVGSPTNYPTLEFAKFDSSLGTLRSVTFDWIVNSSVTEATITNMSAGSVTIDRFDFTRTFSVTGPGDNELLYDLKGKNVGFTAVTLATGQSKTVNNTVFGQLTDNTTITEGLAAYSGTSGVVSLALNNSVGVTPRVTAGGAQQLNWNTSVLATSSGTLQVSYIYDPVATVPEPSSVLLCGAPALLGGFAFLRRTRKQRLGASRIADEV